MDSQSSFQRFIRWLTAPLGKPAETTSDEDMPLAYSDAFIAEWRRIKSSGRFESWLSRVRYQEHLCSPIRKDEGAFYFIQSDRTDPLTDPREWVGIAPDQFRLAWEYQPADNAFRLILRRGELAMTLPYIAKGIQ
jgi:hypothetical protein